MKKPHIGILYQETLPEQVFENFITTVSINSLDLEVKSIPVTPYAMALEWLVPTVIVTYISKSYFDAFLKEMGKDHYHLLKKGLISFKDYLFAEDTPKVTIIISQDAPKKSLKSSYSLLFSIIADMKDNNHFKLLIDEDMSSTEYQKTINLFLIFLDKYYFNNLDSETLLKLESQNIIQGTIFIAYSRNTDKLEFLNINE